MKYAEFDKCLVVLLKTGEGEPQSLGTPCPAQLVVSFEGSGGGGENGAVLMCMN